jgi:alpha-L-fucosidase 2
MEGNFLAMEAVHQMVLQSWGEKVRVFPAVPSVWQDVSFRDLRAEGGFKVSAIRKGGVTRQVEVMATVDRDLRLRDPFKGSAIEARWSVPVSRDGEWLNVSLRARQKVIGSIDR